MVATDRRSATASFACVALLAVSASGCIGPLGPSCAGGAAQDIFAIGAGAAPNAPELLAARLESLTDFELSGSHTDRTANESWNFNAQMTFAVPWTPGGANTVSLIVAYTNLSNQSSGNLYLGLTGPSQSGSGAELDLPGVHQRLDSAERQIFDAINETVAPIVIRSHTGGTHIYQGCN